MGKVLLIAISAALLASTLGAQVESPSQLWGQRFAAAIRSSFPGAQLKPEVVRPRSNLRPDPPRGGRQIWDYEGEEIYLVFIEYESDAEAAKFLKVRTEILPQPSGPIGGYGDEAFILAPLAYGKRRMNLRRHNMVLEIGAPGETALSRLALALVNAIDQVARR